MRFSEVSLWGIMAMSADDLLDPLSAFLLSDAEEGEKPMEIVYIQKPTPAVLPAALPVSSAAAPQMPLAAEYARQQRSATPPLLFFEEESEVVACAALEEAEGEDREGGGGAEQLEEQDAWMTVATPVGMSAPMPDGPAPSATSASPLPSRSPPPPPNGPSGPVHLLSGEINLMHLNAWPLVYEDHRSFMWSVDLYVTTYRIVFLPPSRKGIYPSLDHKVFDVPVLSIDRLERDRVGTGRSAVLQKSISIYTKDMRFFRIILHPEENFDNVLRTLLFAAFPQQQDFMFCFAHRLVAGSDAGWSVYDPLVEMERQGALGLRADGTPSPWRVTRLNSDYSLCSSYPGTLVVPAGTPDHDLSTIAAFRSEQRIVALSWGRQIDNASIWRSSQPKVGMQQNTCSQDEDMLNLLARRSRSGKLSIYDCRPRANAMANMAAGYGYEMSAVYTTSNVSFWDIPNIHAMRTSLQRLEQLVRSKTVVDTKWFTLVEETGWLGHVRGVLQAAWHVAREVHNEGSPVLVHCSHGWDRTSQVVALAQLFLDPYLRTVIGFQTLIEKDWLAFGHPFQLRHGHGLARGQQGRDDQRSPIFLQFLDCVWQLVHLFPSAFEFNSRYLMCIVDNVYSCRFGTLLCNCELERKEAELSSKCPSLWTYVQANIAHYANPFYEWKEPIQVQEASRVKFGILELPLAVILRGVTLWGDYHLRWSAKTSLQGMPEGLRRKLKDWRLPPWCAPAPAFEDSADVRIDEVSQCASDEVEAVVYLLRAENEHMAARLQAAEQEILRLKCDQSVPAGGASNVPQSLPAMSTGLDRK